MAATPPVASGADPQLRLFAQWYWWSYQSLSPVYALEGAQVIFQATAAGQPEETAIAAARFAIDRLQFPPNDPALKRARGYAQQYGWAMTHYPGLGDEQAQAAAWAGLLAVEAGQSPKPAIAAVLGPPPAPPAPAGPPTPAWAQGWKLNTVEPGSGRRRGNPGMGAIAAGVASLIIVFLPVWVFGVAYGVYAYTRGYTKAAYLGLALSGIGAVINIVVLVQFYSTHP